MYDESESKIQGNPLSQRIEENILGEHVAFPIRSRCQTKELMEE
ncbi:MAG: hypothetical protein P1Q69_07020 [Candidatus Thorarchaeota archaeon]|nr:hypothetical protein [Candidatus Thorarchaeota archaeon]